MKWTEFHTHTHPFFCFLSFLTRMEFFSPTRNPQHDYSSSGDRGSITQGQTGSWNVQRRTCHTWLHFVSNICLSYVLQNTLNFFNRTIRSSSNNIYIMCVKTNFRHSVMTTTGSVDTFFSYSFFFYYSKLYKLSSPSTERSITCN